MEKFNFEKQNEVQSKEQCQVKISNRFAALGNLDDVDIYSAQETIRTSKLQPKEVYQNLMIKFFFFLHHRKQKGESLLNVRV
jgi:hypothetical protein